MIDGDSRRERNNSVVGTQDSEFPNHILRRVIETVIRVVPRWGADRKRGDCPRPHYWNVSGTFVWTRAWTIGGNSVVVKVQKKQMSSVVLTDEVEGNRRTLHYSDCWV